ncbi:kinase non-catalytic C-lobe domain-containing protein 1 isoform X2 [Myxocyprinus asiaticus]|uniref:kinase non-catalytic C-lobe domain-containing protein 1 isoform X2 n=1 Tax=Myxocyprinus asiaticus TaxID=70543 RepID=UPI002221EB32|nr:kinase non-catalytic C-lobe domain-containing protein 1 isoform X2 [Myxocyprinus asiaticus]
MGAFGTAVIDLDDGDDDDDNKEEEVLKKSRAVERLPPLLEDEENVSLADILCLRDSCLTEQELWAVCVECVCSLQSIARTALFHTLCVTPDTLAFNAHGNVCFMEQLNDDPEGCFVPPEIEKTGSTFEGHMFSLGSTLSAALDYVIDDELQVELSSESRCLLKQMQSEKPDDRPQLQDVLSHAEAVLDNVSPTAVCRKLSAIGRRVLSIESFQDGWEKSNQPFLEYKTSRSNSVENHTSDRIMMRNLSSDSYDGEELLLKHRGLVCNGSSWSGGSASLREDEPFPDSRSQNSSPVHRRNQGKRPGTARRALNRSCSVPDSNNPPAFSTPAHTPISMLVADLSDIIEEESVVSGWNRRLHRVKPKQMMGDTALESGEEESGVPSVDVTVCTPESGVHETDQSDDIDVQTSSLVKDEDTCADTDLCGSNHVNKSMLCLDKDSLSEWMSLRELLSQCARPFSVKELWALCYTCLSTLQTYIDLPEYLCLDSVYVGCDAEVLFLRPKNTASCDVFFLAPEFQEHGIVTEKACVYGIAAILWATAKFHLSVNQKLAMPRKLKRLLLEMAKRTPIERPSIEMAKKCCRDYLARQGTNAETVWTQLITRVQQAFVGNRANEEPSSPECAESPPDPHLGEVKRGFVPLASEGKFAPVAGPVPHIYPVSSTFINLPEAFSSPATHFSPIILTQEELLHKNTPTVPESERIASRHALEDVTSETILIESEQQEERDFRDDLSVLDHYSSSSSSKTLVNSSPPPITPQTKNQEIDTHPDFPTLSHANGICNNFLLQQDPQTGHLTLLPVQIAVLQPITGLDLLKTEPLNKKLIKLPSSGISDDNIKNQRGNTGESHPVTCIDDSAMSPEPVTSEKGSQRANMRVQLAPHSAKDTLTLSTTCKRFPCLQQVIDLVKEEFAFDGYLDNGVEDLAMGEYIFTLKDLQFETFCRAITEKFCDLYWKQKLLCDLHCIINQHSCHLVSDQQLSSEPVKRATVSLQRARRSYSSQENSHLDHNTNLCSSQPLDQPTPDENKQNEIKKELIKLDLFKNRETEDKLELKETEFDTRTVLWRGETQEVRSEEPQYVSKVSGLVCSVLMESQCSSALEGGADECVCGTELLWSSTELEETGGNQLTPDCSEADMDDSDSLMSDRTLFACTDPQRPLHDSAWALALYGDLCFRPDVVKYAQTLSSHSEAPTLEDKSQELHQQLIIESRNLKRTRNFYHKLIQQERKNKGSDTKLMPSKVKLQFEELKAKVEFLHSVKKYLQVLSVDQWGLALSLLPSVAVCGTAPLDLQHSEDPAVLNLLCEQRRGKCCPLVAATANGLMAYLYARNAHSDGYIQQFFYTYRYFCTPEELLQFLMDKFNSTLGASEDPSSDSNKVYQRTLDLLQFWIGDGLSVDFSSRSCLLHMLDTFLSSEVAPVDSRGESLRSMLQATPRKRRVFGLSCSGDASISSLEEEDMNSVRSLCRKSSTEDAARKSFQWRVTRVVEPQTAAPKEKAFSIAAALPRPCYASLMTQLSSTCLRSEERLPYSQTEYTALHTAQQLTLLEQEIFQACHPVHFLNSRARGVTENSGNISKCVSLDVPPIEGSSLFVSDDLGQDGPLQTLIRYSDSVSNFVSAELVICDSVKAQTALLARFLAIGKFCYEMRNFATAMQILSGLENVIVRQLPAWKQLSVKVCEVLEELRAVQVFLKSDNLCLMEGERGREQPTLPAAHILAMHVQQLEIGAFTMTNGSYKWPKLRNIARVVSQVHAFQEHLYSYTPDLELQSYLHGRIARLGKCDVPLLASDNNANFNQMPTDRNTRRIQDTLRRVKASFQ